MNFIMDLKKQKFLIKILVKNWDKNVVGIYKSSSNILKSEIIKIKLNYSILLIVDYLKMILKKIFIKKFQELRKYFINVGKNHNFE